VPFVEPEGTASQEEYRDANPDRKTKRTTMLWRFRALIGGSCRGTGRFLLHWDLVRVLEVELLKWLRLGWLLHRNRNGSGWDKTFAERRR
jgi:hypothetical protein